VSATGLSQLLDAIETLLHEPPPSGESAIARFERTLTDGYARALELEADRLRLERRIADAARALAEGKDRRGAAELSNLYARLAETDEDVKALRAMLVSLRRHADASRAA
jgi:ABC-type phosphate transport system auxiliary subunit